MIYIFTALYAEAQVLIRRFHLVKNPERTPFLEFHNDQAGIRLTITGTGEIAAAAAVSSVCTKYRPGQTDLLLNVGTCACTDGRTGIFLCHKIIEQATGKTFYPDILYRHEFREEAVMTGMRPCNRAEVERKTEPSASHSEAAATGRELRDQQEVAAVLYEMEAAAIYQAGSYFFGPHQMLFLKLVSDDGRAETVTREQVERVMESCQEALTAFIERLSGILQAADGERIVRLQEEKRLETLSTDLHCSRTMRDSLRRHLHYLELAGVDYDSVIQDMYREGLLPCRDKREGKLCFEEFKRRLF